MHKSHHLSRTVAAALAMAATFLAQSALAQDFIKGGDEKFTFNLGGIVNQFGTQVTLNGATGPGTPIDLEGNGLSKSLTSLQASGTWRITERNRVDFLYFGAKRDGSRTYDRDIVIGDHTIPLGFNVTAETEDQFLLLDYRYSFHKSDKFEVAGMFGIYGGNFKFDTVATGSDASGSRSISSSSSTTVPLPLIGVSGDWYIEPRWKASSSLLGIAAKIGDVDGSAIVFTLGTDYMITRNWGLGLTYMYTRIDVDVTKSGFNGKIDWSSNAVLAYATLKF